MAAIKGQDTEPELLVRRILDQLGVRYGLQDKSLPGRPDIVMRRRHSVIFVHGCFWHRHKGCQYAYTPKSRLEFWETKFAGNVERDRRALRLLRKSGWKALVIWECQTANATVVERRIRSFLGWTPNAKPERAGLPAINLPKKSRADQTRRAAARA